LSQAFEAGLMQDQFWRLTFHEFGLVIAGYAERTRNQRRMLAWMQSNLMGCWIKHPPSINRLMGAKSILGMPKKDVAEHYSGKKGSG
jgi:hypothetical protein